MDKNLYFFLFSFFIKGLFFVSAGAYKQKTTKEKTQIIIFISKGIVKIWAKKGNDKNINVEKIKHI